MREVVEIVARALVDHPEQVVVTEQEQEKTVVLQLRVASADMGKVIGKQGKIARAIRALAKAAGARQGRKVTVEIGD